MAEDLAGRSTVKVTYYAALVEATGCVTESLEVLPRTVGGLRAAVAERHGPVVGELANNCSVLDDDRLLRDDEAAIGDVVDLLPPFAGG